MGQGLALVFRDKTPALAEKDISIRSQGYSEIWAKYYAKRFTVLRPGFREHLLSLCVMYLSGVFMLDELM